ncbi:UEV domain-containing protein [Syncephalis fuscata]|nr:UEV domain-containing protein [Syncephalis fuscata]
MTEEYLRRLVLPYMQTQCVWAHGIALLTRYPTLIPTASSDQTMPLCFQGTLPITFHGQSYHIPLGVWLPCDYPATAPTVRILPTEQMAIRTGAYVDTNGQIRHPYLSSIWSEQTQSVDLVHLCDILQTCFSQDPPVCARSAPQSNSSNSHRPLAGDTNVVPPLILTNMPPQDPFAQAPPIKSPLDYRTIFGGSNSNSPEEQQHIREQEEERQVIVESIRQKLREDLDIFHQQHHERVNGVLTQHTKLVEHEQLVDTAHARLLQVEAELDEELADLLKKGREIAAAADAIQVEPEFAPNELIQGRTALDEQIFELTAKEHAIDDVIDQLSLALRRGYINLPTFLKLVRRQSRDQFLCKALLFKARSQARLLPL